MDSRIRHYARSRSHPGRWHEVRKHLDGSWSCTCERYWYAKQPKCCDHTAWAQEQEEEMMAQQQQGRGGGGGRKADFSKGIPGYVEVKDRIAQFLEDHPEGRLITEYLGVETIGAASFVTVKALAYRTVDDPLPATGLAWEPVPGQTSYTKNSELQNAETSAIGRAIAFVDHAYAEQGIASANEVRNRRAEREPDDVNRKTGEIIEPKPRVYEWEEELRVTLSDLGIPTAALGLSKKNIDGMLKAGQTIEDLARIAADNHAAETEARENAG